MGETIGRLDGDLDLERGSFLLSAAVLEALAGVRLQEG